MALVNRIQAAGITLSIVDDKLKVQPLSALNQVQRVFIREHRDEIIRELQATQKPRATVHDLDRHVHEKEAAIRYWRFLHNDIEVDIASGATLAEAYELLRRGSDDELEPMTRYDETEELDINADDRRYCHQRRNLSGNRCMTAARGEIDGARSQHPFDKVPRRCVAYVPGADDRDQRPGHDRWPGMAKYETNEETA